MSGGVNAEEQLTHAGTYKNNHCFVFLSLQGDGQKGLRRESRKSFVCQRGLFTCRLVSQYTF